MFIEQHPMLLLAGLLLVGALLGQVKVAGVSLGPAAVLFVALGFTGWAGSQGVTLALPEVLGGFGLMLFTYTVGVSSGPSFFGSLKRGWPVMLSTVACFGVVAAAAVLTGNLLGLPRAMAAGAFAGGLTNTPALAAASQASGEAELAAVGYSISYLWGVAGMMLAAAFAIGRGSRRGHGRPRLEQRTIRVDRAENPTVDELVAAYPGISVSRVQHEGGPMLVATPEERLEKNDLLSVVGEPAVLKQVVAELGHVSSIDIIGDRTYLDSIRVTLSVPRFAGRRLAALELAERFGAQVSRVRRGDVDMIVNDNFRLQTGDRLRVVAPRDQMIAIRTYLGDSERGFSDINPAGLALGLTIGVAIGLVPIPLPTGTFTLGSAAGTLIAGLVLGRMVRIGPLPVGMPSAAAHALSSIGMLVFLAYAGTRAGGQFVHAMTSDAGWKVFLVGFVVTVVAAVSLTAVYRLQRIDWTRIAGQLGGAQTQPAVLAFANTRTEFDTRVSLGYALVYPAAMIGKILVAQLMVLV